MDYAKTHLFRPLQWPLSFVWRLRFRQHCMTELDFEEIHKNLGLEERLELHRHRVPWVSVVVEWQTHIDQGIGICKNLKEKLKIWHFRSICLEISKNWHTMSQGPKKKTKNYSNYKTEN